MQTFDVEIGPQVRADLDEIAAYIAESSPLNAQRFLAKLGREMTKLSVYPRRHRVAPESVTKGVIIRQAVCGNYRILFSVHGRAVHVHGVRHAARQTE